MGRVSPLDDPLGTDVPAIPREWCARRARTSQAQCSSPPEMLSRGVEVSLWPRGPGIPGARACASAPLYGVSLPHAHVTLRFGICVFWPHALTILRFASSGSS